MNRRDKIRRRLCETLPLERQLSQLTQRELAERIGCTTKFVSMVEQGRAIPSLETLSRWAEALEMDQCTIYRLISVN